MKTKRKEKLTIIDLVSKILDSELPISTKNEVTRHYLLPKLGYTKAVIENEKVDIGVVERPDAESVRIEDNPKLKAEYADFERLAGVKEEEVDE